jgi:DNA-binding NtrC family response regulator
LIIETDINITKMLRLYFGAQGYEILVTYQCLEALWLCPTKSLKVVLLNTQLPGSADLRENLHHHIRTRHITIIDITQPFDIEELNEHIKTATISSRFLTHPITNLPTDYSLFEAQFKEIQGKARNICKIISQKCSERLAGAVKLSWNTLTL